MNNPWARVAYYLALVVTWTGPNWLPPAIAARFFPFC